MRRALLVALITAASCRFDPAYRDVPEPPAAVCGAGAIRCEAAKLERCDTSASPLGAWVTVDDCGARGLVCAASLLACATCVPGELTCDGQDVKQCDAAGRTRATTSTCDSTKGDACRSGVCVNLCEKAGEEHSNVGCEYWAADLDNACLGMSLCAAAQQYAIVVSNAEPDVAATVIVDQDDAMVGQPQSLRVVGTAVIAPRNLEVFKLGPREIDGSAEGTFNTGTGTALTRHAYRVRASMPIVAYQFNPLDNVNVFSNDASQLLPVEALNSGSGRAYVVAGWPQTIATTNDPLTNFGIDLRGSLAIIATRPDTHVHFETKARVIPGGPFADGVAVGGTGDVVLQPFEVLNLETGDFNADFTGSLIDADQPIVVFPGSEASDAPIFPKLADRFCCADHLEQQNTPIRAIGKAYVLARMPNRSRAVIAAGGDIGTYDEPEYYRVIAARTGTTHVKTTLPPPDDQFDLAGEGDLHSMTVHQDFTLTASAAVIVTDVQAGQDAAGVPRGLPGGDPSLLYVSPIEQWRSDYVLLTPDKYSFDYLVVVAPFSGHVYLDGLALGPEVCEIGAADGLTPMTRGAPNPPYLAYRCQLSYPIIDKSKPPPNNLMPGKQNDGVHHVQADMPVEVIAYGFDSYVSYAYAGGTQLTEINPR